MNDLGLQCWIFAYNFPGSSALSFSLGYLLWEEREARHPNDPGSLGGSASTHYCSESRIQPRFSVIAAEGPWSLASLHPSWGSYFAICLQIEGMLPI